MLKIKLVEKYFSYKVDGFYEIGECRLDIAYLNHWPQIPSCATFTFLSCKPMAAEEVWYAYQRHGAPSSTRQHPKETIVYRLFTKTEQTDVFSVEGKYAFLHLC